MALWLENQVTRKKSAGDAFDPRGRSDRDFAVPATDLLSFFRRGVGKTDRLTALADELAPAQHPSRCSM